MMRTIGVIFLLSLGLRAQAQWQLLSLGAAYSDYKINDLCFVNDSLGFAACWIDEGNPGAVFKTTDGGLTWNPTLVPTALKGIAFVGTDTGYAVGIQGKVYRTVDQGITWPLHTTLTPWWDLRCVYFKPNGESFIGSSNDMCGTCQQAILHSNDGWITFRAVTLADTGLFVPLGQILNYCFVTADTGFAVSIDNVFRTFDGGLNWEANHDIGNGITTSFQSVFYNHVHQRTFVVGRANADESNQMAALHVSSNFGNTWTEFQSVPLWLGLDTMTWLYDGQFVSGEVGYAVGGSKPWYPSGDDGGIIFTSDGGQTWQDDFVGDNNGLIFFTLDCPSSEVCYTGGYNGVIMKKTDADSLSTGFAQRALLNSESLIYPNPVDKVLRYRTPRKVSELRIHDVYGRRLSVPFAVDSSVDVSGLPPGVYVLVLEVGSQHHYERFIKM